MYSVFELVYLVFATRVFSCLALCSIERRERLVCLTSKRFSIHQFLLPSNWHLQLNADCDNDDEDDDDGDVDDDDDHLCDMMMMKRWWSYDHPSKALSMSNTKVVNGPSVFFKMYFSKKVFSKSVFVRRLMITPPELWQCPIQKLSMVQSFILTWHQKIGPLKTSGLLPKMCIYLWRN